VSPEPRQVEPNFRAVDDCGCGCGAFGTLRTRPWANGVVCVKRGCPCPRCRGKRNRQQGLRKQTVARKALGVAPQKFGDANEERWSDAYFANEVKAGKQVGPLLNWWRRVEAQVLSNEATFGDRRRPVRAVAMPEGWGQDGLVVVKLSTWREHIGPALDEFYGSES
jgi:hypothetical protein